MGPAGVLVVDGGSSDGTEEAARQAGARYLQTTRGRAHQLNVGAQAALGDVLLFLHADNWLEPEAGLQLRNALNNHEVLGGAFRQKIDSNKWQYRWIEHGNALRVVWRGLAYGDQAIFIRKTVFEKLGGFPEVSFMEDLLLMRRFRTISRPILLPGPVHVSPRRWQSTGIVRQTLRNWSLISAQTLGISPEKLARFYPVHE